MCTGNIEKCSQNHSWCRKAISSSYCECVFVVLGTQLAMRVRLIVICGMSCSTGYFSTLSHKWYDFPENVIGRKLFVLILSSTFV
jgi:hypothetical protein